MGMTGTMMPIAHPIINALVAIGHTPECVCGCQGKNKITMQKPLFKKMT
jgi:hypothetical protein